MIRRLIILLAILAPMELYPQSSRPIMHAERIVHFTSPTSADLFCLSGVGEDTLQARMTFAILNAKRDTLFCDTFPSVYLIGYGLVDIGGHTYSDAEKSSYIGQRVAQFFADKEFYCPAVSAVGKPDADYMNMRLWRELRKDKTAVGFHFLVGEENNRTLAYSKIRKRVEILFSID